jgi:oligopeptide/dipeptide ABC transporter ATP-binding protein
MSALLEVSQLRKLYAQDSGAGLLQKFKQRRSGEAKPRSYLHAVDEVSFTIADGESLGLVGESGCGKSTLVTMLARLSDPSDGLIKFKEKDIGAIPAANFTGKPERGQIQVVFQDPNDSLNPRFSAFDCIADPLRRISGFKTGKALSERVEKVATQVGLPHELLGRFPHQLSGGQKARVNIGRAIAVNPKLLILDEPTSALDVSVQAVILKLLDQLRRELGMSYLFVSHDLNVVRLLCDRVMVMYLGKVVEIGDAEAIFNDARHPYTKALIAAIPNYHQGNGNGNGAEPVRLSGEPRSPIDPDPNVCRFYGRCPGGEERCHNEGPVLREVTAGHWVACHFA